MPVEDRRNHPRVELSAVAFVLARHNAGISMTIESLSLGGARLAGLGTFAHGERVQMLFEIDGSPLEVFGEVVRVDHDDILTDRIAVRFVALDDRHRGLIRELVRRSLEIEEQRVAAAVEEE